MVHSHCADVVRLSSVLPDARLFGRDVSLASCCSDATRVQPGDIFVALLEAAGDGHDDASIAVARGAAAIVAERYLPVSLPQYIVDDSREAYGRLCQQVVGQPSRRMCTIGVTGSHGKTTIATLIAAIFEAAGEPTGWSTSLGWSRGAEPTAGTDLPNNAPQLARQLADMNASGCNVAVLEVTSQALAERQFAGINFDVAVLSNVRRGDLSLHGTLANYRQANLRLVEHLKSPGLAVINTDDPFLQSIAAQLKCPFLATGLADGSDLTASVVERTLSEQIFLLTLGCETVPVRTRLIGDHYVRHCLQAAAVCMSLGVDLPTIVRGIESVERLPGRMERIECGQSFGVFVDAAQTPDRLAMVLKTLRAVTRNRLITVYGPTGTLPAEFRSLLGRVVERGADLGILTSNNPGTHLPVELADEVMDGYERPARAHFIADRREAIQWALSQAQSGDTVLVAGKGDAFGQVIGKRLLPFDDREVVRNWLYDTDHQSSADADHAPLILRMY